MINFRLLIVSLSAVFVFPGLCALTAAGQATHVQELVIKGLEAFEAGKLKEAEEALSKAVRIEPENPHYAMVLGQLYLVSGRDEEAIAQLEKALQRLPEDYNLRLALAQAYQNEKQDQHALDILGVSRPPEPHLPLWLFLRGFSMFRLGLYQDSEKTFRELLAYSDMRAPAHFFLGNSYFARAQYPDAIVHYKQAIELGTRPDNKALNVYYYNYGLCLYNLAKWGEAARAFEASASLYPGDPLPWMFQGLCQMELANLQEALTAFNSAIEANPSFSQAYYQLAKVHLKLGNRERAKSLFDKVSRLKKGELDQTLQYRLKLPGEDQADQ